MERLLLALARCRFGILTVLLAYLAGAATGLTMALAGNQFALDWRDRIVNGAQTTETLRAFSSGNRGRAALLDAAGNLSASLGAVVAGYSVVGGYGIAVVRGFVGGVVGVDEHHRSRLNGVYYPATLLMQILVFSLGGGAGVNIGLATLGPYFGRKAVYDSSRWLGVPLASLADAGIVFALSVPLAIAASSFEFFA